MYNLSSQKRCNRRICASQTRSTVTKFIVNKIDIYVSNKVITKIYSINLIILVYIISVSTFLYNISQTSNYLSHRKTRIASLLGRVDYIIIKNIYNKYISSQYKSSVKVQLRST